MQNKRQNPAKSKAEPADSRELLKSIIRFMKLNQELSLQELLALYDEVSPEDTVPLSIFSHELSPSEALCKYLKENRGLSFHNIAVLLNRDDRSIWTSYSRASGKYSRQISPKPDDVFLPLTIFQDRSMSILEHVVHHLRTSQELSNSKIARLVNKHPSVIATVAKRAVGKVSEDGRRKDG